jgi:N-acetylglucosaminyldiphosphoundecaprenol N-acetyl-beta-D-mannosaminyltransferase
LEIERIDLLGVSVDIITGDELERFVHESLQQTDAGKNIVLLSVWDLLRARRQGDYRDFVTGADLVVPISKSLIGGARFLAGKTPIRYMPFDFVIRLLTFLESREGTVYLLGAKSAVLRKSEQNVRETFPHLRIVGRCPGTFRKQDEDILLLAIRKSAPSLLLVGCGVWGRERWLSRNNGRLPKGLRLWVSDMFEIFAEKRKRPSRFAFDHGMEWIGFCLQKPFYILRVFPFIYYNILLLIYKLKKKKEMRGKNEQKVPIAMVKKSECQVLK